MPRKSQDPNLPRAEPSGLHPKFIWPTPEKKNTLFFLRMDGSLPRNKEWFLGSEHPDQETYPDHKLIHVTPEDSDGKSRWYYANDRVLQDDYNWEFVQADIGGTKFDGVRRSYLTPRADFDPLTPAAGAAMPRDPDDLFASGYVMSGRREHRTGDDIFDGLYVVETRDYVLKVTVRDLGVDDLNGKALTAADTLYYATEVVTGGTTVEDLFLAPTNTYWGLQSNGTKRSGRQLSASWYMITTEQVVAGTFLGGVVSIDTFTTNDNFHWPAVLSEIEFMDWVRRDGGTDIYPRYEFAPDSYTGPCLTTITRTWSVSPQVIPAVVPMLPSPIIYTSPYFRLAVPSCLHWAVDAQCDIGSEDPIYTLNSGSLRTTPATNYLTWPPTIVGYDDQVPFRGGFLRIKKVITAPDNSTV